MNKLELDIDTAVPLGLIVNELLTNAMKHAFPDDRTGNIKIFLQRIEESTIQLSVTDNGVGFGNKESHNKGFGTQLIQLLVQQLNGKMKSDYTKGAHLYFEFKTDKAA
jgi:two-component sensor histidine kinase